jgi:3-dehydroquinate dehydratase
MQNGFKAGSIVEKVKEELNKTINAKRRLLEKNFINFRFDEFKKGQQQVMNQLEELEKKKAAKSP